MTENGRATVETRRIFMSSVVPSPAFATVLLLLSAAACTRGGEVLGPGGAVVLHASTVRLATGGDHACAVAGGVLSCWGSDTEGQLGVPAGGAGAQRPVNIPGTWLAPAAGSGHSCALAVDGSVSCWGANDKGQLGTNDLVASSSPRAVPLPAEAIELRTRFEFTCAVLADATLWCWGYNWEGQLGQGDQHPGTDRPSPVQVGSGSDRDWVYVSTGQGHACGIRAPGALYCWGRNTDGQLGQGATQPPQIRAPVQVGTDTDWVEVACAQGTTCARKHDHSLWCWGTMGSGALAVGDLDPRLVATRVPAYSDWLSVTNSTFHTCGLRPGGQIWCAGRNTEGQLGSPDTVDAIPTMLLADPNPGWVEVSAGHFFTCARKADDSVWCTGKNNNGQLGVDPATLARSNLFVRAR
jgi:alpha-tubulin suppressor-like RCC1 family protein